MMTIIKRIGISTLVGMLVACAQTPAENGLTKSGLNPAAFEVEVKGGRTHLYRLTNTLGTEVCISDWGARILSLLVPGKQGAMYDVVLGFDSITAYFPQASEFGAVIGRYANRIGKGQWLRGGDTIRLARNQGSHCLHGGPKGWQYKLFQGRQTDASTVVLTLFSPDGDMGFPGNVHVRVTYKLTEDNAVAISYEATTDKETIINMTNHSYFNLSGNPALSGMDQVLFINADRYTPVDRSLLPTGQIASVRDTPFDFNQPRILSTVVNDSALASLDNNWVLNTRGDLTQLAASLVSPASGIRLEVYTTEPGMQVYTACFRRPLFGKRGVAFNRRPSVCLETQHFPDSPNHPSWPSVLLKPGQTYRSECIYKFDMQE